MSAVPDKEGFSGRFYTLARLSQTRLSLACGESSRVLLDKSILLDVAKPGVPNHVFNIPCEGKKGSGEACAEGAYHVRNALGYMWSLQPTAPSVKQETIVRGFDSRHLSDNTLAQPPALWLRAGRGCDAAMTFWIAALAQELILIS